MSAAAQTKIFGVRLGIDPKILVVGLIAIAAALFWFNSRGDDERSSAGVTRPEQVSPAGTAVASVHGQADRRHRAHEERGTLRLRPVDATHGDIDPTLRLDFLDRLSKIQPPTSMRNLFEAGPAIEAGGTVTVPNRMIPVVARTPALPIRPGYPISPDITANIPYKYYGFAKPLNLGEANRGFFMEGDNVLVAVEGQLLENRYLVVQLTPNDARVEDTQLKLGKTLPVVPEAIEPTGGAARPATPETNPGMINQGVDDNQ